MGGGDKPLKEIAGRTILERAIERLRPQCAALILNANGDPARFAATGLTVVPDDVPDFAGPLAGILASLDWAAEHRPDLVYVASAAADTPFLPHDFVSRLHAAREAAGVPLASAAWGSRESDAFERGGGPRARGGGELRALDPAAAGVPGLCRLRRERRRSGREPRRPELERHERRRQPRPSARRERLTPNSAPNDDLSGDDAGNTPTRAWANPGR